MYNNIQPDNKKKTERNTLRECIAGKRLYAISGLCAVTFACLICLSVPKEYAATMEITDEHKTTMELAVGLDPVEAMIRNVRLVEEGMQNPETYSTVIESESFLNRMLHKRVEKYGMTYAEYLMTMNREPWWKEPFVTRDSTYSRELLSDKIRYKLSGKYFTIKLQVKDNDPEVAAVMTDSLCTLLATFLEEHRTAVNNAKMEDALIRRREARKKYQETLRKYSAYAQAHMESGTAGDNAIIEGLAAERDNDFKMYNEACMKYEHYKLATDRKQPYFTVLYNPTIPTEPCSPTWVGYIMAYLFIAWTCTTWWILYKNSNLKDNMEE